MYILCSLLGGFSENAEHLTFVEDLRVGSI